MTATRQMSFTCTFCGKKIEVGETRSWSEGVSIVARHLLTCERVPAYATSTQRSVAINEMARSIIKDPPAS